MRWKVIYHRDGTKTVTKYGKPSTESEMMKNKVGINGAPGGMRPKSGYPHVAEFSGVPKDQLAEAKAQCDKHGVATEWVVNGNSASPVWRSRQHRADWCKAMGRIDRQGGYGDYTGK